MDNSQRAYVIWIRILKDKVKIYLLAIQPVFYSDILNTICLDWSQKTQTSNYIKIYIVYK